VPARNPCLDPWGVTFTDHDGYRPMLSHRICVGDGSILALAHFPFAL